MSLPFYNGWSNYPACNINLWINESEGNYNYWTEKANEIVYKKRKDLKRAVRQLENELKEYFEKNKPELNGSYSDLLTFILASVDWTEIAEYFIEQVEFEEIEEIEEEEFKIA